jgi:malate/lactate dehydrogenase
MAWEWRSLLLLKVKLCLKTEVAAYVKSVSKQIVDNIGGTEFGPAASFRDITRAIVQNTGEVFPIAAPVKFPEVPEATFVGFPTHLGSRLGESLFGCLSVDEQAGIVEAAKAIYQTYQTALDAVE